MTPLQIQKGSLQAKLALKIIAEGKKGLCHQGVAEHVGVFAWGNSMASEHYMDNHRFPPLHKRESMGFQGFKKQSRKSPE